ncbi:DNA helicase UvrD [Candidatus Uhrbacteria bacterium]|nr:DNA helicase UvrD [Candidatus Uhrbacteria bacterium]
MKYIADFHIHSKYSRACSKSLDLEHISAWSRIKGINVVSCADFTHPQWFCELKEKLEETSDGLYELKKEYRKIADDITGEFSPALVRAPQQFILTTELSCIYSKNGKGRRIHIIVFAPTIAVVEKINSALSKIGNIASDGRPILGIDVTKLMRMILDISDDCFFIPAHAWTPWFSVFGSFSGFDSLEECFDELTPRIRAIETGLSSDPAMNWRLSGLNDIALVSNSDAHSLEKLGREATVFTGDTLTYASLVRSISEGVRQTPELSLDSTIEFFPEEGKYHLDGHRLCGFSCEPAQTRKLHGICPHCKKPLTVGVLNRVMNLADQDEQQIKKISRTPFTNIIPLQELISHTLGVGIQSKKVKEMYKKVINRCGTEFDVLLNCAIEEISMNVGEDIAHAIENMRAGNVDIIPGYDGEYGRIAVTHAKKKAQKELFE